MPGFIVSHCAVLGLCPGETCSSLGADVEGVFREWIWVRGEVRGTGRSGGGRVEVGIYYMRNQNKIKRIKRMVTVCKSLLSG